MWKVFSTTKMATKNLPSAPGLAKTGFFPPHAQGLYNVGTALQLLLCRNNPLKCTADEVGCSEPRVLELPIARLKAPAWKTLFRLDTIGAFALRSKGEFMPHSTSLRSLRQFLNARSYSLRQTLNQRSHIAPDVIVVNPQRDVIEISAESRISKEGNKHQGSGKGGK